MANATPSLLALLGLVAVAGYQNRDKISDMLNDARQPAPGSGMSPGAVNDNPASGGGFLSEIGQTLRGGSLSGALSDLVDQFKSSGRSDAAHSWVSDKPNMQVDVNDLESSLGTDTINQLTQKTGLSRDELLRRLHGALPDVVNRLTPHGRLPTTNEAESLL